MMPPKIKNVQMMLLQNGLKKVFDTSSFFECIFDYFLKLIRKDNIVICTLLLCFKETIKKDPAAV